ncbi:TonB-dependent receptor [Povalibacter sp.]|uniref:TonB-dependent receptor plug domain-containing protein n=1 Tax=Povalibacter sp. TaxID=1962978 RepID=UPI002F4029A7
MSNPFAASEDTRIELEEVIVTGSRLRGEGAALPTTVFDQARIEELGISTVPELLKYLPQQSYTRGEDFRFGGAQFVELRGLGTDTTLVLINGRRASVTAANAASNAFDLNTIPVSAIERVEVLSDAASAVYGADAVGGVMNIILKRDLDRVDADLRLGSASGGAEERRASIAGGLSSERFSGTLVLDYFEREFLLGEKRDRWRDQNFTRFGSTDQRSANANPGNVTSRSTANLPGLTSTRAAVPDGSSGVGLTPADFSSTSGQRNLESLARYASVMPESERASAMGTAEFRFTQSASAFVEALYTDRQQTTQSPPSALSNVLVPATHPFNPFDVAVNSNFLLTGLGPQLAVVDSESLRAVAGVRGALGSWDWEVAYLNGQERSSSWTQNAASATRVAASLASTDPSLALNPFQDGPGGSPQLLASLLADPVISRYESDAEHWSAFVRGSLATLPSGDLDVVIGGEYRAESILFNGLVFVDHGREVKAGFAEVRVPLVNAAMSIPGVQGLSLSLAARHDEYSDFGGTFNPQATLTWLPTDSVKVRATYGTSFRPPSLFELYSPRRTVPGSTVVDPRRNNETAIITVISGGNPDLAPITADSWSAGFVWSPSAFGGLQIGATYWNIALDDRVRIFSQQLVLANEALFPERVVRAAPTPADTAAGVAGTLISVDSSRINFGTLETSGVDLAAHWSLTSAWGDFLPNLTLTWVDSYRAGSAPGAPAVDRMDVANADGTITSWRGVVGVSWQRGPWGTSLSGRYIPSYDDATFTGARTGREVQSQWLTDLQVSLDFRRGEWSPWLKGFALQAGVSNLFDEEPPFSEIGTPLGFDLSQGDLRQRFGYLNLSKRF